jgi:hypothetical protein
MVVTKSLEKVDRETNCQNFSSRNNSYTSQFDGFKYKFAHSGCQVTSRVNFAHPKRHVAAANGRPRSVLDQATLLPCWHHTPPLHLLLPYFSSLNHSLHCIMENQKNIPKELLEVVNFLRSSSSGIKTRVGALGGKRHDYFKGVQLIDATVALAY